ncbi:MAG TPA: sugar phosphate nucleotidyltransferase, partial [archaeon]|nr:sugar phosphate nucleotidyltransferase [archaeon]
PKPLIYWSMLPVIKAGIKKFVITTNYLSDKVEEYFKAREWSDFDITIFKEPRRLGKAGSTKYCIDKGLIDKKNLILMQNAADITRNIIPELLADHAEQAKRFGYEVTVVAARKCVIPASKVQYDPKTKSVLSFERKPLQKWQDGESSHVGMFLFEPKALKRFDKIPIPSDPEESVLLNMIKEKKANVFLTDDWIPIKYTSDIENANSVDIEKFQNLKA